MIPLMIIGITGVISAATSPITSAVTGGQEAKRTPPAAHGQELRRDYFLPTDRYILGDELRRLYLEIRRESTQGASDDFIRELAATENEKLEIFDSVNEGFMRTAQAQFRSGWSDALRSAYDAAIKDIQKVRQFVEYGVAYRDEKADVKVIVIGLKQVEKWATAMLGCGVIYSEAVHAWPKTFLSDGGVPKRLRQITAGDWKGAFEDSAHRIFVPGLGYLVNRAVVCK